MRRLLFASLMMMCVAACGGSGSPTAPTTPTYPSVAGVYKGTATFVFPQLPLTLNCSASTTIGQSGSTVTLAPLVMSGPDCDGLTLPAGSFTIDTTGALAGVNSGTATQSCGTYTYTGSGGFSGTQFQLTLTSTSSTCTNFTFTTTLTRS